MSRARVSLSVRVINRLRGFDRFAINDRGGFVDLNRTATPESSTQLLDIVRARAVPEVADRIHALRFARDRHPNIPDTFWAGMKFAEKIARGEDPSKVSVL